VNAVKNFRVPKDMGNYLNICKPVSFSRKAVLRGVSKKESAVLVAEDRQSEKAQKVAEGE